MRYQAPMTTRIEGPTRSQWKVKASATSPQVAVEIKVLDKSGKPVSDFEPIHTKPMHLIAIGSGLTMGAHEHPTLNAGGAFEATLPLASPGRYVGFDEYDPVGPVPETVDREVFDTAGSKGVFEKPTWDFDTRVKEVDGLTFKLNEANLMTGMPMPVKVQVLGADGKPAKLDDWLAAKGHMLATQEGAPKLYHFHPMDGGHGGGHGGHTAKAGELTFHAAVSEKGPYRLFLQVMKPGAVTPTTATFDVVAT
jgi:hypothetical protein